MSSPQRAQVIFVVGTGRSGTHFLTDCLRRHSDVTDLTAGKENSFVFNRVVDVASGKSGRVGRSALVVRYRILRRRAAPRVLLDQSHPNLWNYELLRPHFPRCRWVATVRDPRAVVASMLAHRGVRERSEAWMTYPIPCRFLGISHDNLAHYRNASIAERCAYRWISHAERTIELAKQNDVEVVRYESLVREPAAVTAGIWGRSGLSACPDAEFEPREASIHGWKDTLDERAVREVTDLVEPTGLYEQLLALAQ